MDQQLNLLIQLQEIDFIIRTLTERKNRFPEALAAFERRREENQQELHNSREDLQTAQKNKRDKDKDLEAGIQKVEKLKSRVSEIKTNKEYQALLKEIETAESEKKEIEDDILVLMEKIDAAASSVAAAETQVREEDLAITEKKTELEESAAGVERELKSAVEQRSQAAAHVDPSLLSQYEKLLVSKGGAALSEARAEACSGCFMSIPPQVFVNVKKNEDIITCPNCGRILYYKE